MTAEATAHVDEFISQESDLLAVSPCARDEVRRRTAVRTFVKRQAIIMLSTMKELHAKFLARPNTSGVKKLCIDVFTQYLREHWWQLRKATRRTCLRRTASTASGLRRLWRRRPPPASAGVAGTRR